MQIDIRAAQANALSNLRAVGTVNAINLSWDLPINDPSYRAAEIWVNTVNDRETGTLFGRVGGNAVVFPIEDTNLRYFWIRVVNEFGRTDSPFTGPTTGQAKAVPAPDMSDVVFDLASAQVIGELSKDRVTGLGALAALDRAGIAQIDGLGTLASKDVVTADVIGAGTLAAGVIYAGSINANQINAVQLSAISSTIGILRSRSSGARVEIRDDDIFVIDDTETTIITIGRL